MRNAITAYPESALTVTPIQKAADKPFGGKSLSAKTRLANPSPPEYRSGTLGLVARLIQEFGLETGPGKMERAPALAPEPMQMRLSI